MLTMKPSPSRTRVPFSLSAFLFCFFSLYVCAVQDWEGYVLLNMFDKLLRDRVYLLYSFL